MFPEVSKGHADVVKIEDLKTGRLSYIIRVGPSVKALVLKSTDLSPRNFCPEGLLTAEQQPEVQHFWLPTRDGRGHEPRDAGISRKLVRNRLSSRSSRRTEPTAGTPTLAQGDSDSPLVLPGSVLGRVTGLPRQRTGVCHFDEAGAFLCYRVS